MAKRSNMITTPAGTAIAMISVSVERGSLMGGGAEVGEEEEEEAAGEDVGGDVSKEEDLVYPLRTFILQVIIEWSWRRPANTEVRRQREHTH